MFQSSGRQPSSFFFNSSLYISTKEAATFLPSNLFLDEKAFFASKYLLYQGLTEVLEIIEKFPRLYLFVMNLYFKKHIQTNYPPYKIVDNLFNFISIKQTKKLINQSSEKEKDLWLKAFYENYPENFIKYQTLS